MRTGMRMQVVVGLIMLLIGAARAEEFPADVVRWVPALNKSVFQGAGGKAWDRYIRERGWILIEEGTYHLWYTGFNKDRSPLMLLRACNVTRWAALDPRQDQPARDQLLG